MRALAASVVLLCGCDAATTDPGLSASFRVAGAQFVRGPMPAPGDGPKVIAFNPSRNAAPQGDTELHLSGAIETSANGVAIGLVGDTGYWTLPAGLPDVTVPNALTFDVNAALARDAAPGSHTMQVLALSKDGMAGPVASAPLEVTPLAMPMGALVVSLTWDSYVDLDLHVVDPAGIEIWAGNSTEYQVAPGQPFDPSAARDAGMLDADSNGACVIDGRDREDVIWARAVPPGKYVVRVDTVSLCGEVSTHWQLEVRRDGAVFARANGQSIEADTRYTHQLGGGVLALDFEVP